MSQNDFNIDNQNAPAFRGDLNNALEALATLSSGATAPTTTYANMLWYDTTNNTLKMRSEADDAWISVGYLDQSSNAFRIFDDTQVVNTSGTQTGLIGDQATATWEAGTGTTESLVSPAKVKAAVEALAPVGYTDAEARAAQAGHSAGAIGSYGFFLNVNYSTSANTNTIKEPGSLEAGSNLRYSGADTDIFPQWAATPAPSGTWRLMGRFEYREDSEGAQTKSPRWSVYLRIS